MIVLAVAITLTAGWPNGVAKGSGLSPWPSFQCPYSPGTVQREALTRYLIGSGISTCGGSDIARAAYDFDGFRRPSSEIAGNGEITLEANALRDVFGLDVQVRTDDGRFLKLKFSEKSLDPHANVAHVDVSGDCRACDGIHDKWAFAAIRLVFS